MIFNINIFSNYYVILTILYILISIWITDNDIENRSIDKSNHLIAFLILINFYSVIYLHWKFKIDSLIDLINPINSIVAISFINFVFLIFFIIRQKELKKFIKIYLLISAILLPVFGYLLNKVILFFDFISFQYSVIQMVEEFTLLPASHFPLFKEIFISKTINAFYSIILLTFLSEVITFFLNKKIAISIFLIFLFQFISLYEWNVKFLTERNVTELLTKIEFYSLPESCNNPILSEKNNSFYKFKIINGNKIIYAFPIWNEDISIDKRTNENILKYDFSKEDFDCHIKPLTY